MVKETFSQTITSLNQTLIHPTPQGKCVPMASVGDGSESDSLHALHKCTHTHTHSVKWTVLLKHWVMSKFSSVLGEQTQEVKGAKATKVEHFSTVCCVARQHIYVCVHELRFCWLFGWMRTSDSRLFTQVDRK